MFHKLWIEHYEKGKLQVIVIFRTSFQPGDRGQGFRGVSDRPACMDLIAPIGRPWMLLFSIDACSPET